MNSQLTAIAIDDEPHALDVVRMHAAKVPFLELKATFTDAFEGIAYLQSHQIDVLFLDIKMPDISGLELVNTLRQTPMIIFTTAYSEYAVKGFELDALDYLLKPFSLARFTKACNKALEAKQLRKDEKRPEAIFLKTGYQDEKILLADIGYVEAEGNYMAYVLNGRKLLSRQSISEAVAVLPSGQFERIHRSFVVAVAHIHKISRQSVWVWGVEIPVGVSYESKFAEIKERLQGGHHEGVG
jgi:two-component system, LytTR family, response regulator